MTAAFFADREKIELRRVDTPSPAPGEVLLRVRACGICGSDLHFYQGALEAAPHVSPGHEFAGEVVEPGEGVQGWSSGQRVIVEPLRVCRECTYCRTGQYQLCRGRVLLGNAAPGGLAQLVAVPAYALYPLPNALDFELGALVEPLAVAVHGLHQVGLSLGERVLVLGSGSIGLMAVLAAQAAGAAEVIVTYRHEHQGRAALAAGASRAVRAEEAAALRKEGVDVVVEAVGGGAPTLAQALELVRRGGRISVLGVFTQPVQVNALVLMLKEVRLASGVTYCRPGQHSDFQVALGIMQGDPARARALISHRFPLEEAAGAFAAAADKATGSIKVQVSP